MSHKKLPHVNPNTHKHFSHAVHEETVAIYSMVRFMWPAVIVLLLCLAALIYYARPLPPSVVKMATGQPYSSLAALGLQYAEHFKENGVQLELVTTAGASENLALLKQGKVDVALSLGGMSAGSDAPDILSLGSVEYQPFWLFYRGPEYEGDNPSEFFNAKTFSINIPGSGSRHMVEKILPLHGINVEKNDRLQQLSSTESVDALLSGKIDGVFLTAGIESKTIQRILSDPTVRIFDFSVADAYAKRLKFLEVITLPHGSIDLVKAVPPKDIHMVATTTTILTNKKLHPAIQQLFLSTTHKIDVGGKTFFVRPGGFPVYTAREIKLSPVAERYYTKGLPALDGYVPFWLASFFDQIWFYLFAAFAIGYPLAKVVPNQRSLYASLCIADCYEELTEIDHKLMHHLTDHELKEVLAEFDKMEKKVNQLWIPASLHAQFYELKNSVEIVRARSMRVLRDRMDHPTPTPSHA